MALAVHVCHAGILPQPEVFRDLLDPGIRLTLGPERPPGPVDILVCGRPTREQLALPGLRAVIVPFAGVPEETLALLAEFPHIALHNLHHNDAATAEMALGLLLAVSRRIIPVDRLLRQHDWTPRYEPPPQVILAGRTALILGYGAIGRRLARVLRALDMRVLATRRSGTTPMDDGIATVFPAAALSDLLPQAHVLLITLPLTPETRGLIGARELALLPRGAILVNVGRGPIVDEAALYRALADGHLLGAGLDVWYRYPADEAGRKHTPPSDYPFHELDNVVLSPHRGGMAGGQDLERRRLEALAAMLNTAARGEPLPNRVDPTRGY
ncbi:MAG: 2-hydroxyacid dehydrogenase [Anaerolineae bacterium]|nr:2-hydroxyacid dehydrogenase [Caldilineales bacterium]MDW8267875.1 2-hydroxyacid dehydrogenase [Anaerolineae bacterium]